MVETLTRSIEEDDKRRAKKAAERGDSVQEGIAAIARGEECELERMLHEKLALESNQGVPSSHQTDSTEDGESNPSQEQQQPSAGAAPEGDKSATVQVEAVASEVTEPEHVVSLVEGSPRRVVVTVQLPLVANASDIDAEVVGGQVLELEVEGKYHLMASLPVPIDEEHMSCRFDKKKKVLTIKLPAV